MANFDQKSLKALKKQLNEKKKVEKRQQQVEQQQQIQEQQDENFFREAMSGVNPLTTDKTSHLNDSKQKPAPKILNLDDFEDELEIHDPLSDEREITDIDGEEVLSFCRDGIQKNVFKKLRSGHYRISDELDLHGFTVKQAKDLLVYYLQEAAQFEGCCIRIIHGKGLSSGKQKSVLKTHINHWLREHERVLAFHSAKIRDGGTGAVYVLLKR